jgi:hypothetical protein
MQIRWAFYSPADCPEGIGELAEPDIALICSACVSRYRLDPNTVVTMAEAEARDAAGNLPYVAPGCYQCASGAGWLDE